MATPRGAVATPGLSAVAVAAGVAFLVTVLMIPPVARFARRHGFVALPSLRGVHRLPTPLLGGLAVVVGIGASMLAVFTFHDTAVPAAALGAGLAAMCIGVFDDRIALRWQIKLALQIAIAVAYVAIDRPLPSFGALGAPVAVGWLVLVMNAINFTDNSNGLASGTAALSAAGLAAMAIRAGHGEAALLAVALCGAALGFFLHNFPSGGIFLGDAGSLAIGFLLGALVLALGRGSGEAARAALVLGYPLFDLVFVVVSRMRRAVHFAVGGTDHTVHRLAARLHSLTLAVVLLLVIDVACVTASLVLWWT